MPDTPAIVERLRAAADGWLRCPTGPIGWLTHPEALREAADEIERLRDEVLALRGTIHADDERLRAAERIFWPDGTTWGCDAPEMFAEEVLALRAKLAAFKDDHASLVDVTDREQLGRLVREAWVRWAKTRPNPKPSWLAPYENLSEADKEADRQIGEHIVMCAVPAAVAYRNSAQMMQERLATARADALREAAKVAMTDWGEAGQHRARRIAAELERMAAKKQETK